MIMEGWISFNWFFYSSLTWPARCLYHKWCLVCPSQSHGAAKKMSEYLQQGRSNLSSHIDSASLESLSVKAFSASKCITTNFSACYLYLCVRLYPLSLALSPPILHLLLIHCSILHLRPFIFPPPSGIPARISITSTLLSTIAYKHVLCQLRKMLNISML